MKFYVKCLSLISPGLGKCRFAKANQSADRYDFSLPLPSKENGTRYKIQMEFDISTEVVSKTKDKKTEEELCCHLSYHQAMT